MNIITSFKVSRARRVIGRVAVNQASACKKGHRDNRGFTLVELVMVMAIIGILCTLAIPSFSLIQDRTRESACMEDIRTLEKDIHAYEATNGNFPANLGVINRDTLRDPWGNPYYYAPIPHPDGTDEYVDSAGIPLNEGFDLYSKGKNGSSNQDLADDNTDDDVIHAGDGGFVGLGQNY